MITPFLCFGQIVVEPETLIVKEEPKSQESVDSTAQPDKVVTEPNTDIDLETSETAIETQEKVTPKKEFLPEVEVKKAVSIEEMIKNLVDRVQKSFKLSFNEFSKSRDASTPKEERINVIISFLAMLELIRLGMVEVIQKGHFEEIEITKI